MFIDCTYHSVSHGGSICHNFPLHSLIEHYLHRFWDIINGHEMSYIFTTMTNVGQNDIIDKLTLINGLDRYCLNMLLVNTQL